MKQINSSFVINEEKADESRERFLLIFKKTILRIHDEARDNPIYMIRYSLFTCPWFAVKVHKFFLSDDDCLHDHPWSFLSIILWRGYTEETFRKQDMGLPVGERIREVKHYGPGSILWRPAPWPHRLEIGKQALSLVVTFQKFRVWGFYTRSGWLEWRKYISSGSKCE